MTTNVKPPYTLEALRAIFKTNPLALWLNFSLDAIDYGTVSASMLVDDKHVAPNGFLYAPVLMTIADIVCGAGTSFTIKEPDRMFTTLEISSNFLRTALDGKITCQAFAQHMGKATQVWECEIFDDQKRKMCLFRCTQLMIERRNI